MQSISALEHGTVTIDLTHNHFELFGLPKRFAVDGAALDRRYLELQREVHPDRFATASDSEKRLSMQRATRLNEAYRTLKSPLDRARYLIELAGVDAGIETNTAMPAAFLAEQMEWREALEEASESSELDGLEQRLSRELAARYSAIESELNSADHVAAVASLRQLMFLEKLRDDIADAYEAMEN
jgi:molecular chaperone HscB